MLSSVENPLPDQVKYQDLGLFKLDVARWRSGSGYYLVQPRRYYFRHLAWRVLQFIRLVEQAELRWSVVPRSISFVKFASLLYLLNCKTPAIAGAS
jgi:hypothetical protein